MTAPAVVRVGFTGSRLDPTPAQRPWVRAMLMQLYVPGASFHHGDCVGSDVFGAEVARALGYQLVAHPPSDPRLRAYIPSHITHPPLPYAQRNGNIVARSTALVGLPRWPEHDVRSKRSGTWQTIRMARRAKLPLYVWEATA